jgi:hypothetical protein
MGLLVPLTHQVELPFVLEHYDLVCLNQCFGVRLNRYAGERNQCQNRTNPGQSAKPWLPHLPHRFFGGSLGPDHCKVCGQNSSTRTTAQTIAQTIQVVLG